MSPRDLGYDVAGARRSRGTIFLRSLRNCSNGLPHEVECMEGALERGPQVARDGLIAFTRGSFTLGRAPAT